MVVVDSGSWLFPDRWSANIVLTFTGQLESLYLHLRGAVIKLDDWAHHLGSEILLYLGLPGTFCTLALIITPQHQDHNIPDGSE